MDLLQKRPEGGGLGNFWSRETLGANSNERIISWVSSLPSQLWEDAGLYSVVRWGSEKG